MKIYARVRKPYQTRVAKNMVVAVSFEQYMKMVEWKNKGYIAKDKIFPNLYTEYLEIKNELKVKGLI